MPLINPPRRLNMDDIDISFDFESNLAATPAAALPSTQPTGQHLATTHSTAVSQAQGVQGAGNPRFQQYVSKKNFRQTVCRHWLRGLCMKGEQCGFLHQFDQARMPVCRFFAKYGVCREADCVFKHSTEEVKECNMYKLGFCIHGPLCRYKHIQLPGPPPDPTLVEAAKPKEFRNPAANAQSRTPSFNPSKFALPALPAREQCVPVALLPPPSAAPTNQGMFDGQAAYQNEQQMSIAGEGPMQSPIPTEAPEPVKVESPGDFLKTEESRFFVMQLRDRRDFPEAKRTCQWSTSLSTKTKLNEAFPTVQNVILIFVDVPQGIVCGCARMENVASQAKASMLKRPMGSSAKGIPLKWYPGKPVPVGKVDHLKNKLNSNRAFSQTRDGQEVDTHTGKAVTRLFVPVGTVNFTSEQIKIEAIDAHPPRQSFEQGGQHIAGEQVHQRQQEEKQAQNDSPETQPSRFFVMQLRDRRDFPEAKRTCQWSTSLSTKTKLNEAFPTVQNVILIFVDVPQGIVCGCARMENVASQAKASMLKRPMGSSAKGIPLKWYPGKPVPVGKVDHLKNKLNSNRAFSQTRDGQEVDTHTGSAVFQMFK